MIGKMATEHAPFLRPPRWWEGAALYQVYVRSFQDSDGDGYGDLKGLSSRLGYLAELGLDGVWLSPTMPSPDTDWGYDVSDYYGVHPELGTMEDLEQLIKGAKAVGMEVLLDLVPNHTSASHPWFVEAIEDPASPRRDYYVFADPGPDGGPPNNWLDSTGECAWAFDAASGQYYLHNFLDTQPDLNWWNPAVHTEFERVLRFWFDRGVAGFRIDVAHGLYKDVELRDNPDADIDSAQARFGREPVYSANRPETHEVFRAWRKLADTYEPGRLLLGETWVWDPERLASYTGDDDELQLAFNFRFALAPFSAPQLAAVIESSIAALGEACPVWTASNHDIGRFASHWGDGDVRRARLGLMLLCSLPGTVVLYYGDELAMTDVAVPLERQRDPMTKGNRGGKGERDRGRTPMPWSIEPNGGFTAPGVEPWLPLGPLPAGSVDEQVAEPTSPLALTRALLAVRRQHLAPGIAGYQTLSVDEEHFVYRVGDLVVALNWVDRPASVPVPSGRVLVSTTLERAGDDVEGSIHLAPYEGVIIGR